MSYTLEPLAQILEKVLCPDHQYLILDSKPQIELLQDKVIRLKEALETPTTTSLGSKKLEILESRLIDAAHKAEDVIEAHIVHQLSPEYKVRRNKSSRISSQDLHNLLVEFDFLWKEILEFWNESLGTINNAVEPSGSPLAAVSTMRPDPIRTMETVGLEYDIMKLNDSVIRGSSRLKVIPILGMGGIGKTALARTLYFDKLVREHFDFLAWVTVSREYELQEIFTNLLVDHDGQHETDLYGLMASVYKGLKGRRFLIVMDDVWTTQFWDDVSSCLPDDSNGSRILFTTRREIVAEYADSRYWNHHRMRFLNDDESWELLQRKVFGEEHCPLRLEEIGKRIAVKCAGLPLAIIVIAGLLSTKFEPYFWGHVADNVSSILSRNDAFLEILSSSYTDLPNHLKPCFLYMGAFPAGCEVHSSKLIQLWIAEGFVRPIESKCLEDVGNEYLEDLIDRNMILVGPQKSNGEVKSCVIHDLFREICLRQAREEKFLGGENWRGLYMPRNGINARRIGSHPLHSSRDVLESGKLMSCVRSFLFVGSGSPLILSPVVFRLRMLRVLDVYEIEFPEFPTKLLQLVNLRYLAITCRSSLPVLIKFWYLQTLIFREISTVAAENDWICFWDMAELRHAEFKGTPICLDPDSINNSVLEKLQTLSMMRLKDGISCDSVFRKVPNLRKLGISFGCLDDHRTIDLSNSKKLENLKCLYDSTMVSSNFLSSFLFPLSIKKLNVTCHSGLRPWKSMTAIGSLPNLEVLKLRNINYQEPKSCATELEWEPEYGEFTRLKFLLLENLTLVHWRADCVHFPRLERLVIRHCPRLLEIPSDLGDIPTLQAIEVYDSNLSTVVSAKRILEEQQDMGNDFLQVLIHPDPYKLEFLEVKP